MEVFMIVMLCIIGVLLLIANVYLLSYYSHPDDGGFGADLFAKGVMILGMTLTWSVVLFFPLDVSNSRGSTDLSFRMDILWMIIYITIAVFALILIPACIYWYEADSDWSCCDKIKYSFCYLFISIIVVLAILLITFAFLSYADIPVTQTTCSVVDFQLSTSVFNATSSIGSSCTSQSTTIQLTVSFPIYLIGFMSFISWIIFCVFGGIGLSAFPLDFFYDFCTRPKKRTLDEMVDMKAQIILNAQRVKGLANDVKQLEQEGANKKFFMSGDKRLYNDKLIKLRAATYVLDKEYKMYKIQTGLNDELVCQYYLGLVIGIVGSIISLAWLLHM